MNHKYNNIYKQFKMIKLYLYSTFLNTSYEVPEPVGSLTDMNVFK